MKGVAIAVVAGGYIAFNEWWKNNLTCTLAFSYIKYDPCVSLWSEEDRNKKLMELREYDAYMRRPAIYRLFVRPPRNARGVYGNIDYKTDPRFYDWAEDNGCVRYNQRC